VTEELRTLMRSELNAERPPPLGDLVGTAMRDGRRIRRIRRLGAFGAGTAVAGVVALAATLSGPFWAGAGGVQAPAAAPALPSTAPIPSGAPAPPGATPEAPLLVPPATPEAAATASRVRIDVNHARGRQVNATSAAMLELLTRVLPAGRTSNYGVATGDDLHVQLYLDRGRGPGMIRVSMSKGAPPPGYGGDMAQLTVDHLADDCIQNTVVDAYRPDGTVVQVDVATCLAWDGIQNKPARAALTTEQAVKIAVDSRWGMTMDADLVVTGAKHFPRLPEFG
jgi:hypothetical protein